MRLAARGEQVGGDVADACDIGHELDGLGDFGQLGEELCGDVALEDLCRDLVARGVGVREAVGVRFVKEDLGLENSRGLRRDVLVVS